MSRSINTILRADLPKAWMSRSIFIAIYHKYVAFEGILKYSVKRCFTCPTLPA